MASGMIAVYNPTAQSRRAQREVAPLPSDLGGTVVGFLDNDKPNADVLLGGIQQVLSQHYSFAEVVRVRKPKTGAAAPPNVMDELSRCQLVVTALGD